MTTALQAGPVGGIDAYLAKDEKYYVNARADYVRELPSNPEGRILEIGCGAGATGALALEQVKCRWYTGIDICEPAAAIARGRISEVLVGDVETMDLPWMDKTFDALIMSEVLEHLVDPWALLRRLHPLLKPGGKVFASSPNVSHLSVIRMLLRGQWELADKGIMDRTHLRWFTFQSYRQLFESTGFTVDLVKPHAPLGPRARIVNALTIGRWSHVFSQQVDLRAHA